MSQTELGKRLRPPVTFQQVQKYEKGVNRLTAVRAQQMARIFEIPLDALMPPLDGAAAESALDYLQETDAIRLLQAYRRLERGPLRDGVRRLVELIAGRVHDDERALEGV
jgi:transcriptional regulator with XRE-family HTH domain